MPSPFGRVGWAVATVFCALVFSACAHPGDSGVAVNLVPSAPLADAPPTVPDEELAPGQVQGTAGPVTGSMARLLARQVADDPAVAGVLSAATVISVQVADLLVGMAFPADPDRPLTTFAIDDRRRLVGVGTTTFTTNEDVLLRWHASGESDDNTLALIGGWAAPSVTTVAVRQHGEWIVTDTTAVAGADLRAWAFAVDDLSWMATPFDEIAVYDDRERLLAAAPAAFAVLPGAAAELRGGGWRTGDIGQRLTADDDPTGMPFEPARPVARRTVTISNYGWAVQFARDEGRLHIAAGTRERAIAGDVSKDVAATATDLDADAAVAGTVERVDNKAVIAAGYAADDVAAVRITFDDGAWLKIPTRDVTEARPPMSSRIWAVHATTEPSDAARTPTYYEALDHQGDIVTRVPADLSG